MKKRLRSIVGGPLGVPPYTRRMVFDYRDAIKCGYNSTALTEVNTPAQDYRMVTMFPETMLRYYNFVSAKVKGAIAAANTSNTGSVSYSDYNGNLFEVDLPPFMMNYYIMNPSISPIEVWVEVWCIRRGFLPRVSMADDYLRMSDNNVNGPVYSGSRWNLDNTETPLPPAIHGVPVNTSTVVGQLPMAQSNSNALMNSGMQIWSGNQSYRRLAYKMLSKRRRIVIPPGGINKFKVKLSCPRHMIPDFATDATYPYFVGGDRLVVIKWSSLMGTVSGNLETTHLSEKVHIVVARKARFVGTGCLKQPNFNIQVVEQQGVAGTTRDYNTTAVADHIQRMEVTKTAQQIETVP